MQTFGSANLPHYLNLNRTKAQWTNLIVVTRQQGPPRLTRACCRACLRPFPSSHCRLGLGLMVFSFFFALWRVVWFLPKITRPENCRVCKCCLIHMLSYVLSRVLLRYPFSKRGSDSFMPCSWLECRVGREYNRSRMFTFFMNINIWVNLCVFLYIQ